jgi:hypothetical protein
MIVKKGITQRINIHEQIRALYETADGKIWIAKGNGVGYYAHDSLYWPKELSVLDTVKNLTVRAVRMDDIGNLWIGTDKGIYCYNGRSLKHYGTSEGLANNVVNYIWQDSAKRIWFATDEGVSIMDKGKWADDTVIKYLSRSLCTSFANDKKGNIWIGTNDGLFVYDGKKLRRFDNHTGLSGVDIQCLFIDTENYLWVGTIKGLTRINLDEYSHIISSYSPPVYIQTIKINNKDVSIRDSSLSLDHRQNNMRITYAGLCFKDPYTLSYEYKLSGASTGWIKTCSNTVEFSALPPGLYKFWVKAVSADGVYSKIPASFSFTILPPFWLRTWFRVLEALLLIAAISILFRWRLNINRRRAMLKMEQQRMEEELLNAHKALESYTNNMVEKNILLDQFKEEIEKLQNLKAREIDEVRVDHLTYLNKTSILTEEDWDKFKDLFEQVYKGFLVRLKEKMPDLTQAEVRLICLTKLKIDTKQMARALGVSNHTISKTRYRLRKKMGLTEEDSIDDIAESI